MAGPMDQDGSGRPLRAIEGSPAGASRLGLRRYASRIFDFTVRIVSSSSSSMPCASRAC